MTDRTQLMARLALLKSDLRDCENPKVLARWPNLGSRELKRQLEVLVEEVERDLAKAPADGDQAEAPRDRVVEAVRADLLRRSQLGIKKYGVTLERTDLSLKDWLQHAYEETLDQANYLKRAIIEIEKQQRE